MSKKKITLVILAVALVTGIAVYAGQRGHKAKSTAAQVTESPSQQRQTAIPEQVSYGLIFRLIASLHNAGDYQKEAQLTDEQTTALNEIVDDCQREVAEVDAQAQKIVGAFREKMRTRKAGEPWPKPSAELRDLQRQRDEVILRHRDQLQVALGDEKFARFNEAAGRIVHIDIIRAPASPR